MPSQPEDRSQRRDDLQWPVPEEILDRYESADTKDTGALMLDSADDWQAAATASRPVLLEGPRSTRQAVPRPPPPPNRTVATAARSTGAPAPLRRYAIGFAGMALACAGLAVLVQDPRAAARMLEARAAVERAVTSIDPSAITTALPALRDSVASVTAEPAPASQRLAEPAAEPASAPPAAESAIAAPAADPVAAPPETLAAAVSEPSAPATTVATDVERDGAFETPEGPAPTRPAVAERAEQEQETAAAAERSHVEQAAVTPRPVSPVERPLSQRYLSSAPAEAPASVREAARAAALGETPGMTPETPDASGARPVPLPDSAAASSESSRGTAGGVQRDRSAMADLTWGPSSEAPVGGEVAAAAPGARLPAAAPPSVAEPRGSEGGGATAAGLTDDEAIRVVLGGYRAAYEKLDVAAARSVWPTVDAAALARAFGGLRSQGIRFQECKVDVSGARANANCTGWSTFVPRVGSRNPQSLWLEWRFTLQRGGDGWTIADVSTR